MLRQSSARSPCEQASGIRPGLSIAPGSRTVIHQLTSRIPLVERSSLVLWLCNDLPQRSLGQSSRYKHVGYSAHILVRFARCL